MVRWWCFDGKWTFILGRTHRFYFYQLGSDKQQQQQQITHISNNFSFQIKINWQQWLMCIVKIILFFFISLIILFNLTWQGMFDVTFCILIYTLQKCANNARFFFILSYIWLMKKSLYWLCQNYSNESDRIKAIILINQRQVAWKCWFRCVFVWNLLQRKKKHEIPKHFW